jgi:hypothetical protein
MKEDVPDKKILKTIEALHRERKQILSLPPENALDRILASAEPAALVHSFPEQDFHFLIHDIGPEDALPILSLASEKQWEYILDMEVWQGDRIALPAMSRWFDLLYRADARRACRWLLDKKAAEVEFFLFKNIEVTILEHDQDPSDLGPDFSSLDGVFYIRAAGELFRSESELGDIEKNHYRDFLIKWIKTLADYDHIAYQRLILETIHVLPAETEEEAFRLRNVRLAEKGFLPYDEAVGVYQPLKPRQLMQRRAKALSKTVTELPMPVPVAAAGMLEHDDLFTRSLVRIQNEVVLQQLQAEFAALCNRIIVADHKKVGSQADLKQMVQKACGYLSIGLETMAAESDVTAAALEARGAAIIQRYALNDIFRIGFARAVELKWQASDWLVESWFARQGLPLTFWGEAGLGVLGGLLIKKPLYFDDYTDGEMYRDFRSERDLEKTSAVLQEIKAVDRLLAGMDIPRRSLAGYRFLTYKNLLLTLWGGRCLSLGDELQPLPLPAFKRFYAELWQTGIRPRRIRPEARSDFMAWVADRTGLEPEDIDTPLASILDRLFREIEEEYGRVASQDLEPRYVHLFLLQD